MCYARIQVCSFSACSFIGTNGYAKTMPRLGDYATSRKIPSCVFWEMCFCDGEWRRSCSDEENFQRVKSDRLQFNCLPYPLEWHVCLKSLLRHFSHFSAKMITHYEYMKVTFPNIMSHFLESGMESIPVSSTKEVDYSWLSSIIPTISPLIQSTS